jgi:drug/metabolite transporter (DMT)-like permease
MNQARHTQYEGMSSPRKPVDGFALAMMVLLCSIWGTQQVAIKLAAPDLPPLLQMALRSGLSALCCASGRTSLSSWAPCWY